MFYTSTLSDGSIVGTVYETVDGKIDDGIFWCNLDEANKTLYGIGMVGIMRLQNTDSGGIRSTRAAEDGVAAGGGYC